jgi:uncharacterized RDD family membrane protein YckC
MDWYYARGGLRQGPVSLQTLRALVASGQVGPDDLVWTEGFPKWVRCADAPQVSQWGGAVTEARDSQIRPPQRTRPVEYAGFWRRFAAYLLDGLLLTVVLVPLNLIFFVPMGMGMAALDDLDDPGAVLALLSVYWMYALVVGLGQWLYFALMESSSKQGTLGKMALGIIVTDMDGGRLSFARATGRYFAKMITGLTFTIGYIMAGFTEKKQALHDMIASCLVSVRPPRA